MWNGSYWARRFWAARYWLKVGATSSIIAYLRPDGDVLAPPVVLREETFQAPVLFTSEAFTGLLVLSGDALQPGV